MFAEIKFMEHIVQESGNPALSFNGGDYNIGYTTAEKDNYVIGGYWWTSADFEFCRACGSFSCSCDGTFAPGGTEPLAVYELKSNHQREREERRYEAGWFLK